jgi:hypothetical protein
MTALEERLKVRRDLALAEFHTAEDKVVEAQERVAFAEHECDDAAEAEDEQRIFAAEVEITDAHRELEAAEHLRSVWATTVEQEMHDLYLAARS